MAGRTHGDGEDVVDTRDVVPRQPVNTEGTRVEAIPFASGTTVIIRDVDFAAHNIDHPTVTWDWQVDDFTVAVGPKLSQEAADFLVREFPTQFKIHQG
jgi:hypothetical protein